MVTGDREIRVLDKTENNVLCTNLRDETVEMEPCTRPSNPRRLPGPRCRSRLAQQCATWFVSGNESLDITIPWQADDTYSCLLPKHPCTTVLTLQSLVLTHLCAVDTLQYGQRAEQRGSPAIKDGAPQAMGTQTPLKHIHHATER